LGKGICSLQGVLKFDLNEPVRPALLAGEVSTGHVKGKTNALLILRYF